MRTILVLIASLALLAGTAGHTAQRAAQRAAAAERPPNIVFLYADDLGWGDVGFNGRKEWKTANLDRLARQGTVFKRWYTGAVVCAPSRGVLMTGRYTIHNGVSGNSADLPAGEVTIAEALKERGYRTALFGKWHHGRVRPGTSTWVHPMDQGFDEFFGFTNAVHAWEQFPKELWFGRERKPVEGYANGMFTDRAVQFIREQKERPFFLYLPYIATHFHIQAPPEDVARFKGKFPETDPEQPLNATYAAMVYRLDKEIGRVLKALDEAGLRENTIVVFSSDHGATFEAGNKGTSAYHDSNHPFRGQKRTLWEGGIRVPGVVRWPGHVPAGRVSHDMVHMADVLPTLVTATGAPPKPEWKLGGRNMLPVWTGKEKAPDRTLFWEWRAEGYNQLAAMRGDMKLVITGENPPELFNVETDPGERRSLAPQYQPLAKALEKELRDWLATESEASKEGRLPAAAQQRAGTTAQRAAPPAARLVQVRKIWDQAPHNAFTDLVVWRGRWYCAFREGSAHVSPDGALRILASPNRLSWTPVARITMPNADLRDAKLCVTPDNRLMLVGAAALHQPAPATHQTMAWFTSNGTEWSQPVPIGEPNMWLWRVTWFRDRAYSVGYGTGKDRITRFYSSPDGQDFRRVVDPLFTDGYPNEHALLFLEDGTALCLLRRDAGDAHGKLGISRPPYVSWDWQDVGKRIGGPQMLRLPDGRIAAAVRLHDGKVRTALCWLDPQSGSLTEFLPLPSGGDSSYAGMVWHNDSLWVSYYSSHEGKTSIYLAEVRFGEG